MGLEMKIMYGALIFVAGWFYFYICLRQLIFDFTVAYPLISKFGKAGEQVFAPTGANRMNTISVVIWLVICALPHHLLLCGRGRRSRRVCQEARAAYKEQL